VHLVFYVSDVTALQESQPISSGSQTAADVDCSTLTRQLLDINTPPNVNPFSSSAQPLV